MNIKQKVGRTGVGVALFAAMNLSLLATLLTTGVASASETVLNDPVAGDGCGGVKTSVVKCNAKNSKNGGTQDNGVWALLLITVNIMTAGVGVLAVGGIIYGAVLYTTAEDKANQVKQATDIITNVVIGLVAFALMWAALNFLIPGGVFA